MARGTLELGRRCSGSARSALGSTPLTLAGTRRTRPLRLVVSWCTTSLCTTDVWSAMHHDIYRQQAEAHLTLRGILLSTPTLFHLPLALFLSLTHPLLLADTLYVSFNAFLEATVEESMAAWALTAVPFEIVTELSAATWTPNRRHPVENE